MDMGMDQKSKAIVMAALGKHQQPYLSEDGNRRKPLNDISREEVNARLEASEARVATVVETLRADAYELRAELRADASELRAELREGFAKINSQGEVAQARADKFYADAHALLADSRTALTEIKLAGEQNKVNVMGMGYKFLAWFFGIIVALASTGFTVYMAVKKAQDEKPVTHQYSSQQVQERSKQ